MNVFEVFATLSLNSAAFKKGLAAAEQTTKSFGGKLASGLGTAVKAAAGAVTVATGAMVSFGKEAVSVGMNFDTAMSQVAATMGKSVDEIQDLRDFAQEMGRTTAFSATQSAEALNYMALAGYSVSQSMEMLPNVLNLAAAGSMDLARASDMLTDTQSAFGLTMEDTTYLVDAMASVASKANTSVEQLGDGLLTVGGTARILQDGVWEASEVLGLLADNGIKASEGGTALRNIILSLSAPTGKAKKQLEALGVEVFNASGEMRFLGNIFEDLNNVLGEMADEEKTQVLKKIFNKVDLKSVNALLNTSVERWEDLWNAIDDCAGAAQAMADTQLDNLAGDITLFQSALEGAKIVISDKLTPTLREFVTFGKDGIERLTNAFSDSGFEGALDEFGNILSEGIDRMSEELPRVVELGGSLISKLVESMVDNAPSFVSETLPVLAEQATKLINGLIDDLPSLAGAGVDLFASLLDNTADIVTNIAEQLPGLIRDVSDKILEGDNIQRIVKAGVELFSSLVSNTPDIILAMQEKMPEILGGFINALLTTENFEKMAKALIKLVTNIPSIFEGIYNGAVHLVGEILGALQGLLLGDWAREFVKNSFIDLFSFSLEDVAASVASGLFGGEAGKVVSAILGATKSDLWKKTEDRTVTGHIVPPIRRALDMASGEVATGSMKLGRAISEGVGDGFSEECDKNTRPDIIAEFKLITDDVEDELGINSPSRVFKTIGKHMAEGVGVGFENKIPSIKETIRGKMWDIVSTVKNAMQIKSPSRVFAGIGKFMAQGLEMGWESEIDDVNATIANSIGTDYASGSGRVQIVQNIYAQEMTPAQIFEASRSAQDDAEFLRRGGNYVQSYA